MKALLVQLKPSDDRGWRRCQALILAAVVIVLVAGSIWLMLVPGPSLAMLEETIRSWGMWGVAGSIALMIVHSFVPFPAELLACANGMVYGVLWGTVVTWTGAMLGALLAFVLARRLGRPFVQRIVASRDWRKLDDWTASNGWQVALVSRFIPVIAFNLINYAAGLSRLSLWDFIWTTGVGILPVTILMVTAGDRIDSLGWPIWLAFVMAALLLWLVVRRQVLRR